MRTFKDSTGRPWELQVDIAGAKRVRGLLAFELLDHDFGAVHERLRTDAILMCDVVYVLVKAQADKLGITDEDFGRAMFGDAVKGATEVLLAELADFISDPRDRERARKALATFKILFEKARDVQGMALDRVISESLSSCGPKSGDSPAA